jgi:hypothetical protein
MNDAISARTFAGVLKYRGALWNQREYFERNKLLPPQADGVLWCLEQL